jgi:hypothetical protein
MNEYGIMLIGGVIVMALSIPFSALAFAWGQWCYGLF